MGAAAFASASCRWELPLGLTLAPRKYHGEGQRTLRFASVSRLLRGSAKDGARAQFHASATDHRAWVPLSSLLGQVRAFFVCVG